MTSRRRIGTEGVLLLIVLVAACTGGAAPTPSKTTLASPAATEAVTATPSVAPTPTPSPSSAASPTVEPLPSGLDSEVVAAIEWRRSMGLRTDLDWVIAVMTDPAATHSWAYPILPQEEDWMWARQQALQAYLPAVQAYAARHDDVYGGLYQDNEHGRLMTLWTDDPAVHLAALLAAAGTDAPIGARQVRWSERELRNTQHRIDPDWPLWERVDASLEGWGTRLSENVVRIEISSANPDAPSLIAASLASRLDVPESMFRVESDGTGVSRMPVGKVKGVVVLADGSAPGPDNGLMIGGRSDEPGTCYTEPFGVGPDADGRFTIPCTVGTWVITVWTFDSELKRTLIWGESEPVLVSEDEVPRVVIRVAADTPIGE